jgi:hypothetical protein
MNYLDQASDKSRTNPQLAQLRLIEAGRTIAHAISAQEEILHAIAQARNTPINSTSRWPTTAARTRDDAEQATNHASDFLRQSLEHSVTAAERINDHPDLGVLNAAKASRALAQAETQEKFISRVLVQSGTHK